MAVHPLAACLLLAAQTYQVPPAVIIGVMAVENGRVGFESTTNSNGTKDIGIMQINSIWLPQLARSWGTTEEKARRVLRDDGCTNIRVGTWLLRQRISEAGSLWLGIAHYHSKTPFHGHRYAARVVNKMESKGLVRRDNAQARNKNHKSGKQNDKK